jgi:hypothetical protein
MTHAGAPGWVTRAMILGALLVGTALAVGAAETAPPGDADGVVSEQQILQALKPARTRGFPARGLGRRPEAAGPDGAASPVPAAPATVNLNVPFEYNSSTLKPDAARQLQVLQHALNSDLLRSDRFLVAGHTDARGSAEFNKRNSSWPMGWPQAGSAVWGTAPSSCWCRIDQRTRRIDAWRSGTWGRTERRRRSGIGPSFFRHRVNTGWHGNRCPRYCNATGGHDARSRALRGHPEARAGSTT